MADMPIRHQEQNDCAALQYVKGLESPSLSPIPLNKDLRSTLIFSFPRVQKIVRLAPQDSLATFFHNVAQAVKIDVGDIEGVTVTVFQNSRENVE